MLLYTMLVLCASTYMYAFHASGGHKWTKEEKEKKTNKQNSPNEIWKTIRVHTPHSTLHSPREVRVEQLVNHQIQTRSRWLRPRSSICDCVTPPVSRVYTLVTLCFVPLPLHSFVQGGLVLFCAYSRHKHHYPSYIVVLCILLYAHYSDPAPAGDARVSLGASFVCLFNSEEASL